jgi:hypothetical protein
MRRPWALLVAALLAATLVLGVVILTRPRETPRLPGGGAAVRTDLLLFIVRSNAGPFAAVIGTTGGKPGALVVPTNIAVTVPGQGDLRLDDALGLSAEDATATMANVLGLGIDSYAVLGRLRLAALVDRAGGLRVGGDLQGGSEVVEGLESAGGGRLRAFTLVLAALLAPEVPWGPDDLAESDDAANALGMLHEASGVTPTVLEEIEPAADVFRVEPAAVRDAVMRAFGGPDRELVPVIVLNGSGVPGVGRVVAERLAPAGFTIVVSGNASSFDHDETLVVIGSSDDVALGERVRDLLGTGTVNVSVPSGIAPVTIVVGKDLGG